MPLTENTPLLLHAKGNPSKQGRPQNFTLLILGVWSLIFISSIDQTITATLISAIGSDLQSMQLSSWIGTAYLLSFCGFTPVYGRLANIFGRRPSVIFAGLIFSAGTAGCGMARNMGQLIAARTLAGVGGGMTVVGSIIVSDSVPLRSRALHQGFAGLLFALGGALGGPIGGWAGDTIGWRAAFLGQVPFLLVGLRFLWMEIREPEYLRPRYSGSGPSTPGLEAILRANGPDRNFDPSLSTSTFKAKLLRIDFLGSLSLVLLLLTFLIGMHCKSTLGYAWSNPRVWGLLAASFVSTLSFIYVELYVSPEPMMPLRLLLLRTPGCANLNIFLLSILNFSIIYNVPLYLIAARLRTSTNAGVHLIPLSATIAIGSLFAGWYMRHTGRYWWLQTVACAGELVSCIVLAMWKIDSPEWLLFTTLIPFGIGFSTTTITTILSLISSLPQEEVAVATGMFYLARVMGQVFGVSLSATLTQGLLTINLRQTITGEGANEIINRVLASTEFIHTLPLEIREQAATGWFKALHVVFICQIALAALCFLSALPIVENELPDVAAAKKTAAGAARDGDVEASAAVATQAMS
ncbi:MFS general substrate transporter [Favolaschia claudopus]|uniref:MFS general substrate transporter n=1 Tax=Favolaschia claudopus TaxID=2862362 RepID=A0AAW0D1Q0_9AGAR